MSALLLKTASRSVWATPHPSFFTGSLPMSHHSTSAHFFLQSFHVVFILANLETLHMGRMSYTATSMRWTGTCSFCLRRRLEAPVVVDQKSNCQTRHNTSAMSKCFKLKTWHECKPEVSVSFSSYVHSHVHTNICWAEVTQQSAFVTASSLFVVLVFLILPLVGSFIWETPSLPQPACDYIKKKLPTGPTELATYMTITVEYQPSPGR